MSTDFTARQTSESESQQPGATAEHSRRGFLKTASLGVALAGATAAGASLVGSSEAGAATKVAVPKHATEPLTAFVRDARSGEVVVFVGERQVTLHDSDLAARIARAAY